MKQKILVIYDESGKIWYQAFGYYEIPDDGVMYLEAEVDVNKYIITSIDTSVIPHKPILCPHIASNLTFDEYKEQLIEKSKNNLKEFLEGNPIKSSCHENTEKLYSVTQSKQNLLLLEIKETEYASKNNISYSPSWNACQEEATNDWTLQELYQLFNEIRAFVKPYVYQQQVMEKEIRESTNIMDLCNIIITFEKQT